MNKDAVWRIIRSMLQLVAGGGLGVLFTQLATDMPDQYDPYIFLASTAVTIIAQNIYEGVQGEKLIGPQVVAKSEANDRIREASLQTPGENPPLM